MIHAFVLWLPDVPEGCVIVREHIPISNLFTCLWFNEVDRFTSRDQISFSTVRDKIWSKTNYTINMFLDCERRNFVVQVMYIHAYVSGLWSYYLTRSRFILYMMSIVFGYGIIYIGQLGKPS